MASQLGGQQGIALLIVLAVLGAVSLIALVVAGNSARLVAEASFARDDLLSRQAEISALDIVGSQLSNPGAKRILRLDLGRASVDVEVKPEAAKLDLNLSDEAVLARFISFFVKDMDHGVRIAAAIADWRDTDDLTRLNGAEANAYRDAGLRAGPRNADFVSVGELRGVLGVDETLFDCLRPFLSVRSGAQIPDARFASPILIRALALTAQPQQSGAVSVVSPLGSQSGDVYEITMSIALGEGRPKRTVAYTVRVLGDPREPLAMLDRLPVAESMRRSPTACASLGVPPGAPP